jgi:hypothetical protein
VITQIIGKSMSGGWKKNRSEPGRKIEMTNEVNPDQAPNLNVQDPKENFVHRTRSSIGIWSLVIGNWLDYCVSIFVSLLQRFFTTETPRQGERERQSSDPSFFGCGRRLAMGFGFLVIGHFLSQAAFNIDPVRFTRYRPITNAGCEGVVLPHNQIPSCGCY